MDDGRFDALAVRIGTVGRRGFLKALVGAGGAAMIAARVGGPAAAASKPKAELCHALGNGSFRLLNVAPQAVEALLAHGDGQVGTDAHCSACGDACAADETCQGGACMPICTPESPGYCSLSDTCCTEQEFCNPITQGCCTIGDIQCIL